VDAYTSAECDDFGGTARPMIDYLTFQICAAALCCAFTVSASCSPSSRSARRASAYRTRCTRATACPADMPLPAKPDEFRPFTLADMSLWVATWKPTQIEMTDNQYSHSARKEMSTSFGMRREKFVRSSKIGLDRGLKSRQRTMSSSNFPRSVSGAIRVCTATTRSRKS
jgi:hypothetical protein